jgi:hypothetical protein
MDGAPQTVTADGSALTHHRTRADRHGHAPGHYAFCPASQNYANLTANRTLQHYAHAPCPNFGSISKWTASFDLSHGWTVSDFVRTVGDVSGDGRADLVGFGLDGVYVAVSNGSGFNPVSKVVTAFDLAHGWTVSGFVHRG